MVRRPLLEPNLSAGGLTFTGVALLAFLIANVVTRPPTVSEWRGPGGSTGASRAGFAGAEQAMPAARPRLSAVSVFASCLRPIRDRHEHAAGRDRRARSCCWPPAPPPSLAHLAGGRRHDVDRLPALRQRADRRGGGLPVPDPALYGPDDLASGTSFPAVLLVWAIEGYRRPVVAGMLLGRPPG